eukprot:TRINITY_DN32641_c0_g1_i1.p1 TRINITY_DN32641_c0_g1~~TRINITY_DN32641_c0_g1_i1.p1  ORF type:complete len:395 (-),score=45.95 TRINITY_DN32641_c0_g1_i1:317-1501(-)
MNLMSLQSTVCKNSSWLQFQADIKSFHVSPISWMPHSTFREAPPKSSVSSKDKLRRHCSLSRCQATSRSSQGPSGGRSSSSAETDAKANNFAVLSRLSELGCGDLIRRPQVVHFSGCINESYAFHGTGGDFFVKINRNLCATDMFEGEAEALRQLAATQTIRVPEPLAVGDLPEGGSYVVMEFLQFRPFGMMQPSSQQLLGRQLALLHQSGVTGNADFGFSLTTRLGILPLDNRPCPSWAEFFVERRLRDRLEKVYAKLGDDAAELQAKGERLLKLAGVVLGDAEVQPCLLHGDLWVGNCGLLPSGDVAMFDPATFVGHAEFDLAFHGWRPDNGFPGFSPEFYRSYHSVIPKAPGFEERRRLYQLFHLLNHLLIYGGEYYFHACSMTNQILGDE